MNNDKLVEYYNKFNEEKRLTRAHGIVEFNVVMKYLKEYVKKIDNPKIIDIGAGTGRYSIELVNMGYDTTAVELVKHNLRYIEQKSDKIKAYQGNALDLKRFKDNEFDIVLLFGPLYHLTTKEEKLKALAEAKRICKDNGYILVQYISNDYAVMKHGFIDHNIEESINNNLIDSNFKVLNDKNGLYGYDRLEDIDNYNSTLNLTRDKIVAVDSLTDLFRPIINNMSENEFKLYIDYVISIAERHEMLGFSSHILDILKK